MQVTCSEELEVLDAPLGQYLQNQAFMFQEFYSLNVMRTVRCEVWLQDSLLIGLSEVQGCSRQAECLQRRDAGRYKNLVKSG